MKLTIEIETLALAEWIEICAKAYRLFKQRLSSSSQRRLASSIEVIKFHADGLNPLSCSIKVKLPFQGERANAKFFVRMNTESAAELSQKIYLEMSCILSKHHSMVMRAWEKLRY